MNVKEFEAKVTEAIESMRASNERRIEERLDEIEKRANRPRAPRGDGDGLGRAASTEHMKAYDRFVRRGITDGLADLQSREMSIGEDPNGGFAVPEQLDHSIGELERDAVPMRQVCTVMPVANETYEKLMSQGGATGGWVGETDARPATDTPTLASVKPSFGEVYANPFATQKVLDDAFYDVGAWLSEEIADEFATWENEAFVNGDGQNKPKGLLRYVIKAAPAFGELLQIKSGINGGVDPDVLIDVSTSLKPKYLANARWMMNTATARLIRKLKDDYGQFLWRSGLEAGAPNTLLGKPVVINESMPAPATGSHSIAFGDFKRGYKIADVRGTRILRDPYTKKGFVGFYTTKRLGGGVEDSRAIVVHTLAT